MSILSGSLTGMTLSKYCNALESDDKRTRRKALEELKVIIFDDETEITFDMKVENAYKHILRCFSDKAESCREMSINIISEILKVLPENNDSYFPYIFPILVQRLGNVEIVEPSEEVRLLLVELYHLIIRRFKNCLPQYVEEMVQILLKTLTDPYPKIKKESCDCICDLSQAISRYLFTYTAVLAKPILQNFNYQQSKIRISAIYATGKLFVCGDTKALEPTLVPLAERLFDQAPAVRRAVIEVVGEWLLIMPDRYSFFARFLPLLLTGLHDMVPEIRALTEQLWSAVGQQYLKENEESLKDRIDFLPDELAYYPTNIERPSLGCRTLANRFLHVFVPALAKELKDWRPDIRLRAVQLIVTFVIHAESHSTHFLPALADALSHASEDEDPRVAETAVSAGEALGAFVPAASWTKLLLWEDGDAAPSRGRLRLLAALLRTTPAVALPPFLAPLARHLCGADVREATTAARRDAALDCCEALLGASVAVHILRAADAPRPEEEQGLLLEGPGVGTKEPAAGDATEETPLASVSEEAPAQPGPSDEGAPTSGTVATAISRTTDEEDAPLEEVEAGGLPPLEVVEAPLFRALLTLRAMADANERAAHRAHALLLRLGTARGEADASALWARQLPAVLRELRASGGAWSVASAERRVLEAVLARAASDDSVTGEADALAAALEDAGAAVAAAAAPEQPPEVLVRIFTLLGAALAARPSLLQGRGAQNRAFAAALLHDALCPALVWRAGRSAEATRIAAAACLDALLRALPPPPPSNDEKTDDEDLQIEVELTNSMLELMPLLPALVEDSGRSSRVFALRCAPGIVKQLLDKTNSESISQQICTLFQATLRRLDDVDDEVRRTSLRSIGLLLPLIPQRAGASVQADSAFDVLLIHLDDPDASFRASVLDVLEHIGQLYPKSLIQKTHYALPKFRDPSKPEILLKRLESCTLNMNE